MNGSRVQSAFDRKWWLAWYTFFWITLVWLAACAWLARPLEPWAEGWVGWFTGDDSASQPLWYLKPAVALGSEIRQVEGNPAYRSGAESSIDLGHWREKRREISWAGWIRVTLQGREWPTNFLVVRQAIGQDTELRVGIESGHPKLQWTDFRDASDQRVSFTTALLSTNQVRQSEWFHLAFMSDGKLRRLMVNGRVVAEVSEFGNRQLFLSRLSLTCLTLPLFRPNDLSPTHFVEQDDVVLFDRLVPPEEIAAWVARGRGGWLPEIQRPALASRWWNFGRPVALLGIVVMLAFKLIPQARHLLTETLSIFYLPAYQTVRWTAIVGILISLVATTVLAIRTKQEDQRRFNGLLGDLRRENDAYWERAMALLNRAKDWIAAQQTLTLPAWNTWLLANRFPHDYPGLIGVGYAEQVLPEHLADHESTWSARHGFSYRMHPPPSESRKAVRELAGNPYLPVVLYESRTLDAKAWLTNATILGEDLLFQAGDDQRPWAAARRVEEVAARNEVQTSSLELIAPAEWYGSAIHGLRLYVPWTLRTKTEEDPGFPLESAAWRGVVFANVDINRFFRERLGTNDSQIGFRVYTGGTTGVRYDLVVDSAKLQPASAETTSPRLRGSLAIPFYYRRLYVDAWSTPAFEAQSFHRWSWVTSIVGFGLTALTTCLLFVQVRARESQSRVLAALHTANSELLLAYRERENLSRSLHDGSIQNLYALGLHLQRVQSFLIDHPQRAATELQNSLTLLDDSIAELRQFILTAGLGTLPNHSVAGALEALIGRLQRTSEASVDLHLDPGISKMPTSAGVHVLNMVREATSNALRHSHARHITVRLKLTPSLIEQEEHWQLEISDDGCGFEAAQANPAGRGLKNLASRAQELNGECTIQSSPGTGTQVIVNFITFPPDRTA